MPLSGYGARTSRKLRSCRLLSASSGSMNGVTEAEAPQPYGYHFAHVSPPVADLREMARDYILAANSQFDATDAESIWRALDQQHALEMITAKVEIAKQHLEEFHGAAAVLTVELASQKVYDADKLHGMIALAVGLMGELMRETGKTAYEVLVSLPPLPSATDDEGQQTQI